jgi:hypothetical protein
MILQHLINYIYIYILVVKREKNTCNNNHFVASLPLPSTVSLEEELYIVAVKNYITQKI